MKRFGGFNCSEPAETDRFSPYLMQVLEHPTKPPPSQTPPDVREALDLNLDPRPGWVPRRVGQYLNELFKLYYMGAAEYEFGGIPTAIKYLCDNRGALHTLKVTVASDHLCKSFFRGNPYYDGRAEELEKLQKRKRQTAASRARVEELEKALAAPPLPLALYYLGPAEYAGHVDQLVRTMAKGEHHNKNSSRFEGAADPVTDGDRRLAGWLCLDYPFFLFKDKALFDAACDLLLGRKSELP